MEQVTREDRDRLAYRGRNRIDGEYWVLLDGERVGCLVDMNSRDEDDNRLFYSGGYFGTDEPVEVTGDVRANIMRLLVG